MLVKKADKTILKCHQCGHERPDPWPNQYHTLDTKNSHLGPRRFVVSCSCGWLSGEHGTLSAAERQWERHVEDEMQKLGVTVQRKNPRL